MPLQSFIDKVGPVVSATWLNAVDLLKFTIFADSTTKAQARTALTTDAPLEVTNGGTGQRALSNLATDMLPYLYPVGDIRRYGADTASPDNSTAIQAALDDSGDVYIPPGTWTITSALTLSGYGRLIYGAGSEISIIQLSGAINGFYSTDEYLRTTFRGFSVQGNSATLNGFYFPNGGADGYTFDCLFEDLYIYTGGRAIFLPKNFSCTFINVRGSSYNQNVFEVLGGPATSFVNCYAKQVPAGKCGYRIHGGASFYSCNGIDSPSNLNARWGIFGQAVAQGDSTNTQYYIVMVGCNVEDWNDYGLEFRYDGLANLVGGTFFAKASGTYDAAIIIHYNDKGFDLQNVTFATKGSTKTKLAQIYTVSGAFVTSRGGGGTFDGVDFLGTLTNGGNNDFGYPETSEAAIKFRNIEVTRRAYLDEALLTGAAGTANTDVIALGNGRQTTVGVAGGASALPATPSGYIKIYIGPTQFVIPFYAQA